MESLKTVLKVVALVVLALIILRVFFIAIGIIYKLGLFLVALVIAWYVLRSLGLFGERSEKGNKDIQ